MSTVHVPILVDRIVGALVEGLRALPRGASAHYLVDCTLGGGGHTGALLDALAAEPALARHRVLSLDQDLGAVERGRERFAREIESGRLEIARCRFGEAEGVLRGKDVMGLMADLGFSSDQIEDPNRGLSFQADGPLDMRLRQGEGPSCAELLAQVSEQELDGIIHDFGEERFSRRIAAAIVRYRREHGVPRSTNELAEIVVRAVPPPARRGRIHAATRTFQALRIAVNEEMEELDRLLHHVILSVKVGGRVAILSFHSLEDRKVKRAFRDRSLGLEPLFKKPIEPEEDEIRRNPRARSAKLRIAERVSRESVE